MYFQKNVLEKRRNEYIIPKKKKFDLTSLVDFVQVELDVDDHAHLFA